MQDFKSTVICCTPSYALYISEVLQEMNIKPEDLHLCVGIFGAEPWSESMLIIRGLNVFSSQVESELLEISETEPHYLLIVERHGNLDTLKVQVEVQPQFSALPIPATLEF